MNGRRLRFGMLAIAGLAAWSILAATAQERQPQTSDEKSAVDAKGDAIARAKLAEADEDARADETRSEDRSRFLWQALRSPMQLDQQIDRVPLLDVLDILETLASPAEAVRNPLKRVRLIVDEAAFKIVNPDFDVNRAVISLPKINGVTLEAIMALVLCQLGGPNHPPEMRIGESFITIRPSTAGDPIQTDLDRPILFRPKDGENVADSLKAISRRHGVNIVIDPAVAKKLAAQTGVPTLQNVTVQNAVRLMANMSEVELVVLDNVLYLTTADRATAMKKSLPIPAPASKTTESARQAK